jgi:hypothetical protein
VAVCAGCARRRLDARRKANQPIDNRLNDAAVKAAEMIEPMNAPEAE